MSASITALVNRVCATADEALEGSRRRQLTLVRSLDIDPFDRMLLTTDGTVDTLLEACTGEPIVTRTTRRAGPATLDRLLARTGRWWHPDVQLLELAPAERLIARRVSLRGAHSGVVHVMAESLIAPDRTPGIIADRLLRGRPSLEHLLTVRQLETRRAILDIVAVRAGEAGDHLRVRPSATLARRTYTIAVGGRTVAAVTEWLAPGRAAATTLRRPEPVYTDNSGLSPREVEVVDLVADGLSNADIAGKLYISKRTVESHVDHVKHKLGLESRHRIIAWALWERLAVQ